MPRRIAELRIAELILGVITVLPLAASADASEGLEFSALSVAPRSRMIPGGVCVLKAEVSNRGAQPAQGVLIARVGGISQIESGRQVSLEPGQTRRLEILVQLPVTIKQQQSVDVEVTLRVDYQGREVLLERDGLPVIRSLRLPVAKRSTFTAYALDPGPRNYPNWLWPAPPSGVHHNYELAVAAQVDAGRSRSSASFEADGLPLNTVEWDNLALLYISGKDILEDAASVESIRRFLNSGGRVWILLDQISCTSVRPLLGLNQVCELVDEIELTDFVVEASAAATQYAEQDRRVSLEQAVVMKRVLQSGGAVTHSVRGWPAAITMPVGSGELVLTTLDSRGWLDIRTKQLKTDPLFQSAYEMRFWAKQHALSIFEGRLSAPLDEQVDYPLKNIGRPVVPRWWVATALGAFCLLLACLGLWRGVAGDLRPVGAVAPGLSLAVCAGLMTAKAFVSVGVPECVAKLQVVEVGEDGNYAHVREQSAVHLAAVSDMSLDYSYDGIAVPGLITPSGAPRFLTIDFQRWGLSNPAWPTGVWRYQSNYVVDTRQLYVTARVTDRGCVLDLPSDLPSPIEDAVLAFAVGDAMHCDDSGEGLLADGRIPVGQQRWIAGMLVSDEQQRRSQVYDQYFQTTEFKQNPSRVFYGWTTLWNGPQWSLDLPQRGSALVRMPVRLQRPEPGTSVLVPHGLIQLRQNTQQYSKTTAYNDKVGKWRKAQTMAIDRPFQFTLPEELVPLEAESIEFELDIQAPHRTVSLFAQTATGEIELVQLHSPSIPWRGKITDPSILAQFRDGILDIRLQISERQDLTEGSASSTIVAWQIDYFHATVRGTIP